MPLQYVIFSEQRAIANDCEGQTGAARDSYVFIAQRAQVVALAAHRKRINHMKFLAGLLAALLALGSAFAAAQTPTHIVSARYTPKPYVTLTHPAWSENAVLYQLNTRQFTPEGTFRAAEKQLPRLKALGVDVIWLMPIHPIGEKNRKGSLGSPYAVKDYYGVNPEFGTPADLKAFVAAAHKLGFHVILDWVANHTAWDNVIHEKHPDWYEMDWKGANRPTPWWDWSDIIDLNYDRPGLREYMTGALKYWVKEAGVDGYRCDVAGYVPLDFWENARAELDAIKPVYMLAEFDQRDIFAKAFDAAYAWKWNNAVHDIAMGKADVGALFGYYSEHESAFPKAAQRMAYTENHDQNAWEGTEFERFGPALNNAIALSFVGEGIPLIYNGQEAGNPRRLKFFEKDPIVWQDHPNAALFKKLIMFRKSHRALANAPWGATMVPVVNSSPQKILSFVRARGPDKVFALFNFSGEMQSVSFSDGPVAGRYRDSDTGEALTIGTNTRISLAPWSYKLLSGAVN
jgi:1,4-alpha-glucan branching enzyme